MTQPRGHSSAGRRTAPSRLGPPRGLKASRFRIGRDEFALLVCDVPQTVASAAIGALSPTEREIVELLQRGCSNSEIARLRSVSPQTVANQLASAFRKLNVGSRRELLAVTRSDGREGE